MLGVFGLLSLACIKPLPLIIEFSRTNILMSYMVTPFFSYKSMVSGYFEVSLENTPVPYQAESLCVFLEEW